MFRVQTYDFWDSGQEVEVTMRENEVERNEVSVNMRLGRMRESECETLRHRTPPLKKQQQRLV